MATALKITAKRPGFRRAGIAHPDTPVDHPAGTFTDAQVELLKREPMLVVQEIEDRAAEKLPTKKAELQAWLTERGVEFADNETVAELTKKGEAHLAEQAQQINQGNGPDDAGRGPE